MKSSFRSHDLVLVVLLFAACTTETRVADDNRSPANEETATNDTTPSPQPEDDAEAPHDTSTEPRCDPAGAFGTPEVLTAFGDNAGRPWLTADEKTLLFDRTEGAGFDLLSATRSSSGSDFGEPEYFSELNTTDADYGGSLSADGLELWYVRGGYKAYRSARDSVKNAFTIGEPQALLEDGSVKIGLPRKLESGVHFIGWGKTSGSIYRADDGYGKVEYTPQSGESMESYALTSDERTLYVTVEIGGTRSVRRVARTNVDKPFGAGAAVPSLSGFSISWISTDECVAYGGVEKGMARATRGK